MKYLHYKNRAILSEMVRTDFKIRYQGSVLGYVWSLLKPLLLFAVLYILFNYIAPIGKGVPHYGVSLLLGIVLWNFFAETTMIGASSMVAKGDLIRKISIPRYLIVLSSTMSALINLTLSMTIVIIFALLNGIEPSLRWLGMIIPIIELFLFSLGLAFMLATAYVRFRDVTYIWEVVLQAGFYASMIITPISIVPLKYHDIVFLNPIVQIVQDARYFLISPNELTIWSTIPNILIKLVPILIIITICAIGVFYFKAKSKYFAEDV